mmetsp:Transcript_32070/g.37074  ORF Transcript_32070/g.37074 Transcript_32070/m.37074 type:complete len:483 (-) Transcript_32070:101-1549(-)
MPRLLLPISFSFAVLVANQWASSFTFLPHTTIRTHGHGHGNPHLSPPPPSKLFIIPDGTVDWIPPEDHESYDPEADEKYDPTPTPNYYFEDWFDSMMNTTGGRFPITSFEESRAVFTDMQDVEKTRDEHQVFKRVIDGEGFHRDINKFTYYDDSYEYYDGEFDVDEDGMQVGWSALWGDGKILDRRSIVNEVESHRVAPYSAMPEYLTPDFAEDDPETQLNKDIKKIRWDMKVMETHTEKFTGQQQANNVIEYSGEKMEQDYIYDPKPFMNNRFTEEGTKTDFTKLSPHMARKMAIQLARSKNNEWLPRGKSEEYKYNETRSMNELNVLYGSFQKGPIDEEVHEKIKPVLKTLGSCATLLSIQVLPPLPVGYNSANVICKPDSNNIQGEMSEEFMLDEWKKEAIVIRFRYWGKIKNKMGMQAWAKGLITDCGVDVTGVVFEAGERMMDPIDCNFLLPENIVEKWECPLDEADEWYALSMKNM